MDQHPSETELVASNPTQDVQFEPSRTPASFNRQASFSPDEVAAAEALLAAALSSAKKNDGPVVVAWGAMADSVHESQIAVERQRLFSFLTDNGMGNLVAVLHANGIKTFSDLRNTSDKKLRIDLRIKESKVRKLSAAILQYEDENKDKLVGSAVVFEGSDNFQGTYEEVMVHEAKQTMLKGTLIKLAKDPNTLCHDFLLAARIWPEELIEIVVTESDFLSDSAGKSRQSRIIGNMSKVGAGLTSNVKDLGSGIGKGLSNPSSGLKNLKGLGHGLASTTGGLITGLGGLVLGDDEKGMGPQFNLTTLHLFFHHCPDLTAAAVTELHRLQASCLSQVSSAGRTPIHHLFAYNTNAKEILTVGLLWALYESNETNLVEHDSYG
jgi:hypothetical protein